LPTIEWLGNAPGARDRLLAWALSGASNDAQGGLLGASLQARHL